MEVINWSALSEHPEKEVQRICSIQSEELERELTEQAAVYGYAAACYEVAKDGEARAKQTLEIVKAKAFERMKAEDAKKAVSAINAVIEDEADVKKAQGNLLQKTKDAAILRSLVKALEHRRDMLVQLSARQREEFRHH